MLQLPHKLLSSFLLIIALSAFLAIIPVAVLPVEGQVFWDGWDADIEEYLLDVDFNTTAEIVVCVVDSLYGHGIKKDGVEINDINMLAVYIFNELPLDTPSGPVVGIGKKDKDNGVLVLFAIEEQQWKIEVGYGLEGDITDTETAHIAEDYLVPYLQEGNDGQGFAYTVIALALEIPQVDAADRMPTRGRYVYENPEPNPDEGLPWWVIVIIVIVVLVLLRYGVVIGGGFGRGGGGGRSGGGGGGGRSGGGGSGGRW